MNEAISDNNEPLAQRNTRANLARLLNEIIEQPERRVEISESIDEVFGQDKALVVLDMSGFTRTTQRHGIVSFLLMIHQMKLLAMPCIEAQGGLLIKAEADNLLCLFDTVPVAVRASLDIVNRLETVNPLLPEDRRLYASIGIGYGRVLNIEDKDLFGDEVNLVSKIGEDLAGKGEVLLSTAAHAQLGDTTINVREEVVSISGLSLTYYAVQP